MDKVTAVFAVLGEAYFQLRMTQDRLSEVEQEAETLKMTNASLTMIITELQGDMEEEIKVFDREGGDNAERESAPEG